MDISDVGAEGKKRGRPKGEKNKSQIEVLSEGVKPPETSRRRTSSPTTTKPQLRQKKQIPSTTPFKPLSGTSSSRPSYFIIGMGLSTLPQSKLPKSGPVLARLLALLEDHSLTESGKIVSKEVKAVWLKHFGTKQILGKEYGKEAEEGTNENLKMIVRDDHLAKKVVDLYRNWKGLEKESRRPDRSITTNHQKKVKQMKSDLDLPFDVRKIDAEDTVQKSGMLDWREEVQYMRSQLTREQASGLGPGDKRQKKRDDRLLKEGIRKEAKAAKAEIEIGEQELYEVENTEEQFDDNENDKDFVVKEVKKKMQKIDVMGKISNTCDARNISLTDRTMVAASVANALGVDIRDTNINRGSAWRKGQKARVGKSNEIKESFKCPEKVVIHWDGKTLILRGREVSKRVCVYLSGVEDDRLRKLLGIPETESGKGVDEFEEVKECLLNWGVKEQVVGMVFDTTASNSGEHSGACRSWHCNTCNHIQYSCRYIEFWLDTPILWLACRKHIAELHLGTAVKCEMGCTKDPRVALFRRLRSQWNDLEIDYSDLDVVDYSSAAPELKDTAQEVLLWALEELLKNTFPRDDYREFLELVVVCLGGEVKGFRFKLPGPDHHARWMSKCLYFLKIRLLRKVFKMSEEENGQVDVLTEFILLFYAKYWFTTPLASSAARHDLEFISSITQYRLINPKLAYEVLSCTYRHLWYLTPQLVTLALTDTGLEDSSREKMARVLHSQDRVKVKTGKPVFPVLPYGATKSREDMSSMVGEGSWLIFDLLKLTGPQDWLLTPVSTWPSSSDYVQLLVFTRNLTTVNDLAERGIHLATEFIRRVESEEQRQALFQVVEDFRNKVKDSNKASLQLC